MGEEFIWVLCNEHFTELMNKPPNQDVYSEEEYLYKDRKNRSVSFRFAIGAKSNNGSRVGFGIKVKHCSEEKFNGTMSVSVTTDTGKTWMLNRHSLDDISDGSFEGAYAFEDKMLEQLDSAQSLTVRVAMSCW